MLVSYGGTPTWQLYTVLCKFVQNISTNIWSLGKRIDLKFGEMSYLFISHNIIISRPYTLNGLRIIFWLRDSATQEWRATFEPDDTQWNSPFLRVTWRNETTSKLILKQLDYSPSFSTSDSRLGCASLTIARRKLELVVLLWNNGSGQNESQTGPKLTYVREQQLFCF